MVFFFFQFLCTDPPLPLTVMQALLYTKTQKLHQLGEGF